MTSASPEPRTAKASRGADWISEGYRLFRAAPGPWIGLTVIWLLLAIACQTTSTFLGLLFNLISPVLSGGIMLGCAAQQRGEAFRIDALWAGFSGKSVGALVTLGVFSVLGLLLASFAVVTLVGASFGGALLSGSGVASLQFGIGTMLAILIALLIYLPVTMALWFAPALVVLGGAEPIEALKVSFNGSLANIPALTVNGLLMLLIAVLATIPFGLGWLVAFPVLFASVYFSYCDIYGAAPESGGTPA